MFGPRLQEGARRWAEWLLTPLRDSPISPNVLTLIGLVLSVVTAGVIAGGHPLAGGCLVLVAGLFDMFDGALARVKGIPSVFGAFFDSCLDRVSEGVILLGVLLYLQREGYTMGPALVFAAAFGSLMISYARARAEGLGLECKVGLLARPERVVLLAVGLILHQWLLLPALILMATLTTLTTVQRIVYVRRTAPPPPTRNRAAKARRALAPAPPGAN